MDLTALVDFSVLAEIARNARVEVHLGTQGEWLTRIGIGLRAQALARHRPESADDIEQAYRRLTDSEEMGELFKVMALTPRDAPPATGFG